jgi:hypothetical protein
MFGLTAAETFLVPANATANLPEACYTQAVRVSR